MKNYILISKAVALTSAFVLLCGCAGTVPKGNEDEDKTTPELEYKDVLAANYGLKIPDSWTYTVFPGEELSFTKDNEAVGGVEVTVYYPDQPLSGILPNHSEELSNEKLSGYPLEGYKTKLQLSEPAASSKTGTTQQLRYVFISGSRAYHIYLDSGRVSDAEAETIAKSFKLNNEGKEIKTDTGTYTGQVDNNSIEIKLSYTQGTGPVFRVFKISEEVRPTFDKLALKKDDMVKFEYYEVDKQQPVLVSIERIIVDANNPTKPETLTLTGKIKYNEVESGYYELEGYRLTGDFDFEKYQNQTVIVTGEVDNSPSIYMVKTLKVTKIEVIEGK